MNLKDKQCIKCGTNKGLIQRNAHYHGVENDSKIDVNLSIGVIICVMCYDKLPKPRDEQIQILGRQFEELQKCITKIGLKEGRRKR